MAAELTVDRLRQRIARAMGWRRPEDWPAELEPVEIANEAGEWLYSIRDWFFLNRPVTALSLTADQSYIDLPADFGRIDGDCLPSSSGYAGSLRLGSLSEVRDARTESVGEALCYVGTIVHTGPVLAGPRSVARLDIGPIPSSTTVDAFLLAYRAGWVEVGDGSDHILTPSWLEAVYIEAATAFVGGREHEEDGNLFDRLDRLIASSLFAAAMNRDSAIQSDFGPVRGGVGEVFGQANDMAWPATGIPIVGSNV